MLFYLIKCKIKKDADISMLHENDVISAGRSCEKKSRMGALDSLFKILF